MANLEAQPRTADLALARSLAFAHFRICTRTDCLECETGADAYADVAFEVGRGSGGLAVANGSVPLPNPLDHCPTCGARILDNDPAGCELAGGQRYCLPHMPAAR